MRGDERGTGERGQPIAGKRLAAGDPLIFAGATGDDVGAATHVGLPEKSDYQAEIETLLGAKMKAAGAEFETVQLKWTMSVCH